MSLSDGCSSPRTVRPAVFLSVAAGSDHGYSNRALKLCRAALSSLLSETIDVENVFTQELH